jgi:hypothetical protein
VERTRREGTSMTTSHNGREISDEMWEPERKASTQQRA